MTSAQAAPAEDWLARRGEHPDLCPLCGLPADAELALALGELQEIPKAGAAQIQSDRGSYTYRYLELADLGQAVRGVLAGHHLALMQPTTNVDGRVMVTTVIRHASGTAWSSPPLELRATADAKQLGAAISYLRRYSLAAYVGLAGDAPPPGPNIGTPASPPRPRQDLTQTQVMWSRLRATGMPDEQSRLWVAELLDIPELWVTADLTPEQVAQVVERLAQGEPADV